MTRRLLLTSLLCMTLPANQVAAEYTVDWYTIDGGGNTTTLGPTNGFAIVGTIGQPDAGVLAGGGFEVVGGFWGIAANCFFDANDCNGNMLPDACELATFDCNGNGVPDNCDIVDESSRDVDFNGIPDECQLPLEYGFDLLCDPTTIAGPLQLSFLNDGLTVDQCDGSYDYRLFAGRGDTALGKIWRINESCQQVQFGAQVCEPESVLVDSNGYFPGSCVDENLIVVGGCDTLTFISPINGFICGQLPDSFFMGIGQLSINSFGELFVGSIDGDSLNILMEGVVLPFFTAPGQSPRAVTVDADDNVYVTTAVDGVLTILDQSGVVIDGNFATGLEDARSMAIAPDGPFRKNLYVACGAPSSRIVEVDLATGASSVFMSDVDAHGIAFDPAGFMHVSLPGKDLIVRVEPTLRGDMNGDAIVDLADLAGFTAALLQDSDAPLPIRNADMNEDGCSDGLDVDLFTQQLISP